MLIVHCRTLALITTTLRTLHHPSLDWLAALPPGTNAYDYFRARLTARHRLRSWLRRMHTFLDPASAAALRRAGASVARLQAAEARLGHRLPWELFELLRWADGQERVAAGRAAQALNGARLLGLSEVVTEAEGLAAAPPAGGGGVGAGSEQQPLVAGLAGVRLEEGWGAGAGPQLRGPLLPFTDVSRGGRQYAVDLRGRVWLRSGFNTLPAADSLAAFVRRCLT